MKIIQHALCFVLICLLSACVNGPQPEQPIENYSYPLALNNSWLYSLTTRNLNCSLLVADDSTYVPLTDTSNTLFYLNVIDTVLVSVDRLDSVLLDTITFVLKDTVTGGTDANTGSRYLWYQNKSDGLYLYAHVYNSFDVYPKLANGTLYEFGGKAFAGIRDLLSPAMDWGVKPFSKKVNSAWDPTIEQPPKKTLQYPFQIGSIWDLRTDPLHLARTYVGKEDIICPAGTFSCYKIKRLWDLSLVGNWDASIEGYEWVSPVYGLVKTAITARGMLVYDGLGRLIGKFDRTGEAILIGYQIINTASD